MKKLLYFIISLIFCLGLYACTASDTIEPENTASTANNNEDSQITGVPNPMTEATPEEIQEQLGISFTEPGGATDISYYIIDMDGDNDMAQMDFTMDGISCTYRIMSAGIPENGLEDISGMYYDWTNEGTADIQWNSAELYWIEGGQGYITWYDYAPGLLYCVSMDSGASESALVELAETLYVPAQGDAEGDTQN